MNDASPTSMTMTMSMAMRIMIMIIFAYPSIPVGSTVPVKDTHSTIYKTYTIRRTCDVSKLNIRDIAGGKQFDVPNIPSKFRRRAIRPPY